MFRIDRRRYYVYIAAALLGVASLFGAAACGGGDEGASAEDVKSIVESALEAQKASAQPVSASEIQQLVTAAISDIPAVEVPKQVSAQELQQLVESAVAATVASAEKPLSSTEISALVQAAVTAATASAATPEDIQAAVAKAATDAAVAAALAVPTAVTMAAPAVGAAGQKYGGTVKLGVVDFGTMDPALMGFSQGSSMYSELAYDTGTVLWYDGALTPWAIESWSANSDASQYTFKVRQGIQFHHGKEMKAEDIKFTFDRILDETSSSALQGQISYIDKITAVDDYTVVFDLAGPNVFLPAQLTIYHGRIVPSDVTDEQITTGEWGSGPFTLTEHNPVERTVMDAFPNYWRAGVPYVDRFIIFYMPEQTTQIEALKSGAIDVVLDPSFSSLETLEANPNVLIKEAPTSGHVNFAFHTNVEPFNNKDVRKAFQYAVDRTFVREAALFGRGANANDHPVGLNDQYHWDEQPILKQDIPRAMEFLTAAGYPDGIDVVLTVADFSQMLELALAFKESVAAAGIRIEINLADSATYWEEAWNNPCCPFAGGLLGQRPANEVLNLMFRSTGGWNETYYFNDRLEELLDLADAEPDFATRKEYYREIQEMLIEDVPSMYTVFLPDITAHRIRMQGMRVNPNLSSNMFQEWWIDE